ncbi:MAG: DNA repair protein RecN [Dehalococcoidales bacterium]|nr:DNA repair protein RecN [Dehalococcoidales bacterium]
MLEELTVRGFGIIEEISLGLAPGLNVITGETGAGKSLVVSALEALLSGDIGEENIRHGAEEARIDAIFRLPENDATGLLRRLLEEKGRDSGEGAVFLSLSYRRGMRATVRVNGELVARSLLRDIGSILVDIHGQSEHLSLRRREQHREFLDAYARNRGLRGRFAEGLSRLRELERALGELNRSEQETLRRVDLLRYQIDEIRRARLIPGEEEALERELHLLASAEKLKELSSAVYSLLYDDEGTDSGAAVERINRAIPLLRQLGGLDTALRPKLDCLEEMAHRLTELAHEMRDYADRLEADPRRLGEVQSRLDFIRNLKRKYGGSIEEIQCYLARAEEELHGLTTGEEKRRSLEKEREALLFELGKVAQELSRRRKDAAESLARAVKRELADLAMGRVEFAVSVTQEEAPDGLPSADGKRYRFNATGIDDITFMAATNPGEVARPLDRIASTGEISRFLLALKGALARADTTPVLVFDEIDLGVGGRSGEIIGKKLWALSRHHQVVCVTHLAQIAAFADAHYRVVKKQDGTRTVSAVEPMRGQARLEELAMMISGTSYTASALDTARELLARAEAWKKSPVS